MSNVKRDAPTSRLSLSEPPTTPDEAGAGEVRGRSLLRSKLPDTDQDLARQCVLDTAERASTATFIYPGVWLAVTWATHAGATWPWLVWGNVLGLGLLAVLRATYARKLPQRLRTHPRGAEIGFNALSLLSASYWGTLTALCMTLAPLQPLAWTMLAVTVGLVAGGNTMLSFNPALCYPYPFAMLMPVVVAEVLPDGELKIAGLLHDCGKVTTPVHVVDKATKLHTICDRRDLIDTRFEVIKRDVVAKPLPHLDGERFGAFIADPAARTPAQTFSSIGNSEA